MSGTSISSPDTTTSTTTTATPTFHSYAKMSDSTATWHITSQQTACTRWCVTEKIHGANFVTICDGHMITYAKRKQILQSNESFFAYHNVMKQMETSIFALFPLISSSFPTMRHFYIYGELFGGHYPHPDINTPDISYAIQTGVWYTPSIQYHAFDLAYVDQQNKHHYIDYGMAINLFQQTSIPYAIPLLIDTYQKCSSYQHKFITTIPSLLGLPSIKENYAEGIVIKPLTELVIDTNKGPARAIVKKKIMEFTEKQYDMAEKPNEKKTNHDISHYDMIWYEMQAHTTHNRLESAVSKCGPPISRDIAQKVLCMFYDDVMDEISSQPEYDRMYGTLSENDKLKMNHDLEIMMKEMIIIYVKTWKQQHKQQPT